MDGAPREFQYALIELPPGRVPFRRWRWELWQGAVLLACGWRLGPGDAERALRTMASRRAHDLIGVRPLRPEQARSIGSLLHGGVVSLDCGAVACVLVPRREDAAAAAA